MSSAPQFNPKQLKAAREKVRHSQHSLAKAIGISRTSIASYEGGDNVPGANILSQIAHELGQPYGYFFEPSVQNPVQAS